MAKTKKKRNKKYAGRDAAVTKTTVTRVSVPDRSKTGKWWYENKKKITSRFALFGALLILYGLVSFLLRWIF